jgi:hypothetical protein
MNLPGFHAEASLYQTTVRYNTVAHDISKNLVLPQLEVGPIIEKVLCYIGCGWGCVTCILTCRSEGECGLCKIQCGYCDWACSGSRL